MPDDVVFVEEIPHTATGKIQKIALRERFKDYVFPMAVACVVMRLQCDALRDDHSLAMQS